jgi:glutathionylspermidine synthase
MRRQTSRPRDNWPRIVESQGLVFHSIDEIAYWDESVYYEFTRAEIDQLELATDELNVRCLDAVQYVIDQDRLGDLQIPPEFHEFIRESWERDEQTVIGRFDLVFDGRSPPKLLEYNADTPTSLLEAAVIQWHWLRDQFPLRQQFNSIHDRLIEAWSTFRAGRSPRMVFAALGGEIEDFINVNYLRDTAIQAGWQTDYLDIETLGWNEDTKIFTDLANRPLPDIFKLYPWEWMHREQFGPMLARSQTRWLEPPWKAILSNKGILAILWEMFPDHPNLLPASFQPLAGDHVRKPLFSREGANIQIVKFGMVRSETGGPYDGPLVYQQLCELPNFQGFHPCIGSWLVNGWACGIGVREDESLITGNVSRFVPHLF